MQNKYICGMMPASNDLGATLTSPFLQFLLDMNTASSLFDLVISGPISASLANSLSTFAPAAKMLCEENRLRLCGLEKHVCEMIRRDVLGGIATCDTAFVPAGLSLRNFRCAFFDMDSTLIGNECIDELAALYDVKDQVAEITERSMRGELDFEHSLRERVKLLAGAPSSIISRSHPSDSWSQKNACPFPLVWCQDVHRLRRLYAICRNRRARLRHVRFRLQSSGH